MHILGEGVKGTVGLTSYNFLGRARNLCIFKSESLIWKYYRTIKKNKLGEFLSPPNTITNCIFIIIYQISKCFFSTSYFDQRLCKEQWNSIVYYLLIKWVILRQISLAILRHSIYFIISYLTPCQNPHKHSKSMLSMLICPYVNI